jgi:hypothetical protein
MANEIKCLPQRRERDRRPDEAMAKDNRSRLWPKTTGRGYGQRQQDKAIAKDDRSRLWLKTTGQGYGQRQQVEAMAKDDRSRLWPKTAKSEGHQSGKSKA